MNYVNHNPQPKNNNESLRLEGVLTCVGFDDMLDYNLTHNHMHFDHMIVVTNHSDHKTKQVCKKHGVRFAETDLFYKNGRNFNKGAAINAGFDLFQYRGWRLHLDVDILLPDNFRRMIFNHTHLDTSCIYHADRIDVIGIEEYKKLMNDTKKRPQAHHCVIQSNHNRPIRERYIDPLRGFVPIGYFQLWHFDSHKDYPYSLGSAAHDDVIFGASWPVSKRVLLPSVIVTHLTMKQPQFGENWDGHRAQPKAPPIE